MNKEKMEWTDLFMPMSQFNHLLTGCGYEPVTLENEFLLITDVQGICDVDFSVKPVTLNGETYTWGGSSTAYPDFARMLFFYFVVPDEAVANMPVAYTGAAYTLEEERRRFAILYRLGADERMQKSALLRQTGAFFLMPFAFPLLLTVPVGVIFGKVYEIWNLTGLSGGKAMETAVLIALVIAGIYALYFVITYFSACSHVLCCGGERQENFS